MMEEQVPSFPIYITLPVWGAVLVLVLMQAWRLRDACATFVLLATWLRYSVATFHQYTYPPLVLGLSAIALTSIGVVAIGFLVIGGRKLLMRRLMPIYGLILIILLSAIVNQRWIDGVNATFKWLYLIVFALATHSALQRRGSDAIFRSLAVIFAGPIILQWLSVPWGLKTTAKDGSSFFIGGFQHQQSISIIFLTFLFITCFSPSLSTIVSYGRLVIVAVGVALANYRTSLLAATLPASALVVSRMTDNFFPRQRVIAFLLLGVVAIFVLVGLVTVAHDRFADLGVVLDKGASLIKPPESFTTEDKRLFSGRLFLWSQYIDAYLGGDCLTMLIGFGPDSWVGRFSAYAHNTFISYLYEFGIFGVASLSWVLLVNFVTAARVRDKSRLILVSSHVGVVVLNLSTMGIWTLEGAILYALLLSQTWHLHSLSRAISPAVHYSLSSRVKVYGGVSMQEP